MSAATGKRDFGESLVTVVPNFVTTNLSVASRLMTSVVVSSIADYLKFCNIYATYPIVIYFIYIG